MIANRYRVLREIGRGNMGKVFRVEHLHTGEHLALKLLLAHAGANETIVERFKREARAPALIKSPHVVRVTDADVAPELHGAPFLVMELLEGMDLQEHLRVRGKLPPLEALGILEQIGRGLDRAHAAGIVHRDLKPANVFLHCSSDGVIVKVLDFGISRIASGERHEAAVTVSGVMMGTPLYMPPEQATGDHQKIGPGTDIWALGMLAFHLMTGRTYWKGSSMAELMAAILAGPKWAASELGEGLSPAFDAWFARSCQRDVSERWPSVWDQIIELANALSLKAPNLKRPSTPIPSAELARTMIASEPDLDSVRAGAPEAVTARPRSAATGGGERRQVTGMFCRMTAESSHGEIDPEDLRDALAAYNATCERVLEPFGRPLSHSTGDGLIVYFGYPKAYGDDAKRAITAALEILDAVRRVGARFEAERGVRLHVTIGIHTAMVVAGDSVSQSAVGSIVGQAPDLALQIEAQAEMNSVVVSAATERLVTDSFESVSLGTRSLRGISGATELFRIQKAREDAGATRSASRARALIGRSSELGMLLDRWEQAASGAGQIALITGEPGIGKSRLIEALRESLSREEGCWLECGCSPYFSNTALYPIRQVLKKLFPSESEADSSVGIGRLEQAVARYRLPENALTLLALALDVAPPASAPALNMSPQRQKQETLEVLGTLFLRISEEQPLVLVIEDLHWADPSTLELLLLLVEHCGGAAILLLLSTRPGFTLPWAGRSNLTQLMLGRLSPKRVETLITELAGDKQLPRELVDRLLARTDGIPLFVEELTRVVLESGVLDQSVSASIGGTSRLGRPEQSESFAIPSTLRDSLTARLDSLGPARATAQLAATIGREFGYELLAAISPFDGETLRGHLKRLQEAELIFQRGLAPRTSYTFKHSLIQEAAYDSLLKRARKEAHAVIAAAMLERFPEQANAQPELLAHHFERAERNQEAARYLTVAGQRALERSALRESVSYLTHALALLQPLPSSRERLGVEALARTALGVSLMFAKGYGAPEVEDNYARALVIDRELGGNQPLPVLWGLWIYHHVSGRYGVADGMTEQMLTLANETHDSDVTLCAHLSHGSTSLLLGRLEPAREHLTRTTELYDEKRHAAHAHLFGQDPAMFSRAMLGWSLWLSGYPDRARRMAEEAVEFGRRVSHPNSLAFALGLKAALHQYCGDAAEARRLSETLTTLCNEQGLLHWMGLAQMVHGWAVAERAGEDRAVREAGAREAMAGRAAWQMTGSRVADTHWAALLIEVLVGVGDLDAARALLSETFAFMEQSAERSFEPELHRLRAELAIAAGTPDEAEASLRRALEVAERAGSRALGLRAATSLYRLKRDASARTVLAESYAFFDEGHDTRDLRAARELLGDSA